MNELNRCYLLRPFSQFLICGTDSFISGVFVVHIESGDDSRQTEDDAARVQSFMDLEIFRCSIVLICCQTEVTRTLETLPHVCTCGPATAASLQPGCVLV